MILEILFAGCCIFQTWQNINLVGDIHSLQITDEILWGHIHELYNLHSGANIYLYKKIEELEKKNKKME